MKVTYHGYYGAKNSGDDAFVEVASWGAKKFWNANDHLFFADTLPTIKTSVKNWSPHKSYFSFSAAVFSVFNSDVFLSAGGSTFHSSLQMTDLRLYAKWKKKFHINGKTGAIGISLGPFISSKAEKDTISYLKTLDFLALRDNHSYNLACSYDLPFEPIESFDLAALLPLIYPNELNLSIQKSSTKKIIGISVCNYERYVNGDIHKEDMRNEYVLQILKILAKEKNYILRFFIFNGHKITGDEALSFSLIKKLEDAGLKNVEIVPYLSNVAETWNKVKECDLVISSRLHASIFACFAQVPFFLLEYHRKCTDFLNDIGQYERYRLHDGSKNVNDFIDQINEILNSGNYVKPKNVTEAMNKALYNFTKVESLVR
jgi:polysaccharide pyruvyl transferase WcaK-like protein